MNNGQELHSEPFNGRAEVLQTMAKKANLEMVPKYIDETGKITETGIGMGKLLSYINMLQKYDLQNASHVCLYYREILNRGL